VLVRVVLVRLVLVGFDVAVEQPATSTPMRISFRMNRSMPQEGDRCVNNYRAQVAAATVPDLLFGCWKRAWIKFADGTIDDTTTVFWLQTESLMVDVRINIDPLHISRRSGLHDCTIDELHALALNDASSGFTRCGQPVVGADGLRGATASWNTRGHGINFQPVSAFPEPGLMTWNADGTVMMECAPSGAYVEEWRLVPGTRYPLMVTQDESTTTYRSGGVAVLVRDRQIPIPRLAQLSELVDEFWEDRTMIEQLLDCEFSVAELHEGEWRVTASTLPWRQGAVLDVE